MTEFPRMCAVVEILIDPERPVPWPVADVPRFLTLEGRLSDPEVGAVMAVLMQHLGLDDEEWPEVAAYVVASEGLFLPGGLQASDGIRTISPGCCCELERWRQWLDFLHGGSNPDMGHLPDIWVNWDGDVVRVWTAPPDGGEDVNVEFGRERLAAELARVERDLYSFLGRVGEWAAAIGWPDPAGLCAKLDREFSITAAAIAD